MTTTGAVTQLYRYQRRKSERRSAKPSDTETSEPMMRENAESGRSNRFCVISITSKVNWRQWLSFRRQIVMTMVAACSNRKML